MKGINVLLHLVSREYSPRNITGSKKETENIVPKEEVGLDFLGLWFGFFFLVACLFVCSNLLSLSVTFLQTLCTGFVSNKEKKKSKVTCFFVKEQAVMQSKKRKLIYHNCCLSYLCIVICVPQAMCFNTYLQPTYTHAKWTYIWHASSSAIKQMCISPVPTAALEGKKLD